MTEPDGLVEKLLSHVTFIERVYAGPTWNLIAKDMRRAADALSEVATVNIRQLLEERLRLAKQAEDDRRNYLSAADALSAAQRSNQRLRELWQAIRQTQGQIVPVLNDEMIPVSLALQWADQLAALLSERSPTVEKT